MQVAIDHTLCVPFYDGEAELEKPITETEKEDREHRWIRLLERMGFVDRFQRAGGVVAVSGPDVDYCRR